MSDPTVGDDLSPEERAASWASPTRAYADERLRKFSEKNGFPVDPMRDRLSDLLRAYGPPGGNQLLGQNEWDRLIDQVESEAIRPPRPSRTAPILWEERKDGSLEPDRAAFVEEISARETFITPLDSGEILRFHGGIYNGHAERFIDSWVEAEFRSKGETASAHWRTEVAQAVRARTYVDRSSINPPGWLCLENGLLDLRSPASPVFVPSHDPQIRLTFKVPVGYDTDARCPVFERALERAVPDGARRSHIQEEFGYCLVPGNPLKFAFFWVGPHDTMKSTLLEVLRGVLGPANTATVSLQALSENRFASAALYAKLACIYADLSPRLIRDVGLFKLLTGGADHVPAEKKFQEPFSFRNPAKLFFSANTLPAVPWADEAFFRRWVVTEFNQSVPPEEQIANYEQTLLAESPGILNWALEGLARLTRRGRFDLSGSVGETRDMWRRMSDSLAWFAEKRLKRADRGAWIPKNDLYSAYAVFCEEHGVEARSQTDVGRELPQLVPGARAGFPKAGGREGRTVRAWMGLGFQEETDGPSQPTLDDVSGSTGSTGSTPTSGIPHTGAGGSSTIPKPPVEHVESVEPDVPGPDPEDVLGEKKTRADRARERLERGGE